MDIIIKTEPPDDTEYLHVKSVPEDSQWQKKRSKLHSLLFGCHGNSSPRVSTPEPQPQPHNVRHSFDIVKKERSPQDDELGENVHAETNGFGTLTDTNTPKDDNSADTQITVKIENVEEAVAPVAMYNKGCVQPESTSKLSVSTKNVTHQNRSRIKPVLMNVPSAEHESHSSLLKSMLTCPMSNIKSPSFGDYQLSFNENLSAKQKNSSEIRKMLSEPPKSGSSPHRSVLQSSIEVPKLSSLLNDSLFSSVDRPGLSSSASSLLKQLSDQSRKRSDINIFSFIGGKNSEQSDSRKASGNASSSSSAKQVSKSLKTTNSDMPHVNDDHLQDTINSVAHAKTSESMAPEKFEDDSVKSKTKAIEEAVGNFSQFLQKTMSTHDFSAEQMKFIMESAMQNASKVITEAAKKTNASENMKATAAHFIENAIGNAIRTETLRKTTNKSSKAFHEILRQHIVKDPDTKAESDSIRASAGKPKKRSSKSSKKRRNEEPTDLDKTVESQASDVRKQKKKKRKVQDKETPETEHGFAYFEGKLSTAEERPARKSRPEDEETENFVNEIPVITVKEEPVDYDGYYESNNLKPAEGIDGCREDKQTDQIERSSHDESMSLHSKNSNSASDGETSIRFSEIYPVVGHSMDKNGQFSEKMFAHRESNNHDGLALDQTIVKLEPGVSEATSETVKTTTEVNRTKQNVSVEDILQDQITKSLKEPMKVEKAFKCPFCNELFDHPGPRIKHVHKSHPYKHLQDGSEDYLSMLSLNSSQQEGESGRLNKQPPPKCYTCGQDFEHKETLQVHERDQIPKSDKSFQCMNCRKCSSDASYVKLHSYSHTSETTTPEWMKKSDKASEEFGKEESGHSMKMNTSEEDDGENSHITLMMATENVDEKMSSLVENGIATDEEQNSELESVNDKEDTNENISVNPIPDISHVKIEPKSPCKQPFPSDENKGDKSQGKVNDVKKKNESFVNFLDKEIEKSLKETFGIVSYKEPKDSELADESGKPLFAVFKCETCGQQFEHKGTLKVHQRGHNFKNKTYQCPICGKCVTDTSYLKIHMRTHQNEIEFENKASQVLRCEVCKLQFSSYGHYQIHLRMHSGEKLFKCEECGTGFTSKNQLNVHESIHTGLKPFKCHICGMSFRQNGGLRLHLLVHTDEKPKKCPFCKASFSRKAHLDKHIRYHSGERPFVCEICSKSFVDKELLKQHTKNVHVDGKPGKRGIYKHRAVPDQIQDKLGPNWKGFVAVDPSDEETEIPKPCFPCGVCGETFGQIASLVEHLEIHNDTVSSADSKKINSISSTPVSSAHLYTDYTISEILNSSNRDSKGSNISSPTASGLGGLNIEKAFKCPFCEESFDLPGPRIRHIHEAHPIKNTTAGFDASKDEDYFLNRHLIEQRTMVEELYGGAAGSSSQNTHNTKSSMLGPAGLSPNARTPNMNAKMSDTGLVEYRLVKAEKDGSQDKNNPQNVIKLPCPYCDRIYQRQSSRTRHINEMHRDKKEAYKLIKEIKERQLLS